MEYKRKIYYYKHHFKEFYRKQDPLVRKKIDWVLGLIRDLEIVKAVRLKREYQEYNEHEE